MTPFIFYSLSGSHTGYSPDIADHFKKKHVGLKRLKMSSVMILLIISQNQFMYAQENNEPENPTEYDIACSCSLILELGAIRVYQDITPWDVEQGFFEFLDFCFKRSCDITNSSKGITS